MDNQSAALKFCRTRMSDARMMAAWLKVRCGQRRHISYWYVWQIKIGAKKSFPGHGWHCFASSMEEHRRTWKNTAITDGWWFPIWSYPGSGSKGVCSWREGRIEPIRLWRVHHTFACCQDGCLQEIRALQKLKDHPSALSLAETPVLDVYTYIYIHNIIRTYNN